MKHSTITISGTAVALAATAGLAIPALAAGTRDHALKLEAKQIASTQTDKTHYNQSDKVRSGGKVIGHDVLDCTLTTKTTSACDAVFALPGGLIESHVVLAFATHSIRGAITGGTRTYQGISGHLTGRATGSGASLTLTYRR